MTGIALCALRDGIMPVCSAVAEPPHDMDAGFSRSTIERKMSRA